MSEDFEKVLVLDDRLCVTSKLSYAVMKGAQNMTPQVYQAISQSPSSITWNVQVPNENVVLDRRLIWQSTWRLKFQFPASTSATDGMAPAIGKQLITYGLLDALSPFPNHQLTTVQSISINNNVVSLNTRDVLPLILSMNDKRELNRYNGLTPNMMDTYYNYSDGVGALNNPLGGYANIGDNDLHPRGSFVLNWISSSPSGGIAVPNYTGAAQTVYVSFTSSEPVLVSPFVFANPKSNNQGFYGIQNCNFVFNIGDCSRVWRSASPWLSASGVSITVDNVTNSRLIFNQLSPHPSQLMPSRNVVPYALYPRYLTTYTNTIATGATYVPGTKNIVTVDPEAKGSRLSFTNIQLNQCPDKLIIAVRKRLGAQTNTDSDSFLAIRGISINFNNQSGILSTATPQDLYRYSVEAGSNQSWEQFWGYANVPAPQALSYQVLTTSVGQPTQIVPTSGSVLALNFGQHIQLSDDYFAPGSLANMQLQFNLDVVDQTGNQGNDWEIVLITVLSGLFVNERGTSSSYTGILTRADVLEASSTEPYKNSDVVRMVGGGFNDTLASVKGIVGAKMPMSKKGSDVLSSLGYGRSGGGASGGGMSGGRKHRLEDKLM